MKYLIIGLILLLLYVVYLWFRNIKTATLLYKINQMCGDYSTRHISDKDYISAHEWFPLFKDVNSIYTKMLFSLKPLKIENWISEEDLDKLNN